MKKILYLIIGMMLTTWSIAASAETIVVIVNKASSISSLSSTEINNIYRGRVTQWSNGAKIAVVNLSTDNIIRKIFYNKVLAESNPAKSFYVAGSPKAFKAKEKKSAGSILRFVKRFDSSIGYIPKSKLNDSVKVVYTMK